MDPVANMLSQIKNANAVGNKTATVPYSKFTYAIAQALVREGFIAEVDRKGRKDGKYMELTLAYENDRPKISGIRRVSKLSRRAYTGVRELQPVRQGHGRAVLSTPKGVCTLDEAKKENVGGELLFEIW